MPVRHDEAVCIRHWDYSESSQTVGLFARGMGLVRGIAKGARRPRGSFGGGIDLLTRGECGAIVSAGRELSTLVEWSLLETFPHVRTSVDANRIAYYAADLVGRTCAPHDPHPELYDALVTVLRDAAQGAPALLRFQWSLLCQIGWQPRMDIDDEGDDGIVAFDPRAGGLVPGMPEGAWKVRMSTVDAIRRAASHAGQGAGEPAGEPDAAAMERANRLLGAHLREMLGAEPDTMRALFGTPARS